MTVAIIARDDYPRLAHKVADEDGYGVGATRGRNPDKISVRLEEPLKAFPKAGIG